MTKEKVCTAERCTVRNNAVCEDKGKECEFRRIWKEMIAARDAGVPRPATNVLARELRD